MVKAVVFDMDGILIFSERGHLLAFQEVAEETLGHQLTEEDYQKYFVGRTDAAGWAAFCEHLGYTSEVPILVSKVGDAYLRHFNETVEPNWPMVQLARDIDAAGIVVAVTSSSSQREVEMSLALLQIAPLVRVIVSADMVAKGKPDPEPYLLTAELLGIDPAEAVVIEDSPAGIQSALAAGMKCIGVTTTHDAESLKQANCVLAEVSVADIRHLLPE